MSSGRRAGADEYVVISGGTSNPRYISGVADPSAGAGVASAEGSLYSRFVAGAGQFWIKTGAADTGWTQLAAGGGSLDDAYDYGGAGAGRSINVTDGAVELICDRTAADLLQIDKDAIGEDATDADVAFLAVNSTPSADINNQQYSPIVALEGQGWESVGGASYECQWGLQVLPTNVEGTDPGYLRFLSNDDDGGWTERWRMGENLLESPDTSYIQTAAGSGGDLHLVPSGDLFLDPTSSSVRTLGNLIDFSIAGDGAERIVSDADGHLAIYANGEKLIDFNGVAGTTDNIEIGSDVQLRFGTGGTGNRSGIERKPQTTGAALIFAIETSSHAAVFCSYADGDTDWGLALQTDPTVYIHGNDESDLNDMLFLRYASGSTEGQIGTLQGDLFLNPAGNVKFGTYAALSGETVQGYVTIDDAGGTPRKIAVVA